MSNVETNKVPPDGGYGWVVTIAYAMNNVVVLPLIAGFALVLNETDLTATQVTFVIVLNHSIGMLLSFFGGPMLSRFGYRKVAVLGAICISGGLMIMAAATEFWQFILSYSIICSMGVAAIMAAFTLAINSFFKDKRGRAVGVGMSITGLGSIYMPLLMSFLMYTYGWRYAVLIISAICLHSLVAACLLRPAKWYLKDPPTSEEAMPLNNEPKPDLPNGSITPSSKAVGIASLPLLEGSGENGVLPSKSLSMRSLNSNSSLKARNAISHPDILNKQQDVPLSEARYKWWESQEINLSSSINIFNEAENLKTNNTQEKEVVKEKEKKGYFEHFVQFFDLTLLKDPIFVNIVFGLSIAACVETNFSLLLPIILKDMMKFETSDIAKLMSVIGFSDTLFRFVSPFIGEWCNKSPRIMYMVSLLMIIFTRSMMLFTSSFMGMLFVSLALGITKAMRTVYVNIVIPNYVPIHRLAFASGIQMFFSGITIFTIGTLLTRVREASGSYIMPIIVLNFVTFITIISWSAEFIYFRLKDRKQQVVDQNEQPAA
ncbi:monocarboxylate transporter 9-like [Helicoverpa zea]|uniref:monocarboxylate transporter 9-like n=1 Tax=Helicoverpa zea TaxID=7113 RepID=UPI001F56E87B|nr:monocarboxylate transporter 9-like [Helicoverpa zea]